AYREAEPYLARYAAAASARNQKRPDGPNQPASIVRVRDDFQTELDSGNIIAGDAARCIEVIHQWQDTLGLTTISGTFYFGGLPPDRALETVRRFAADVMPAFRPPANGASATPARQRVTTTS